MKKKTLSKLLIVIICVCVLSGAVYIGFGLFGTVSMAAGACGGGYKSYVIENNKTEIADAVHKAGASIDDSVMLQIQHNMKFDGRTIRSEFYDHSGEKQFLSAKMKWFWNDCAFSWHVENHA